MGERFWANFADLLDELGKPVTLRYDHQAIPQLGCVPAERRPVKGANIIMIIEGTLSSSGRKNTPEFIELRERKWTAATLRSRKAPTIDSA